MAVLAVALLGFVASLRAPLPGRTEPDRRPRVQRSVPYEVPAPAATRPAPGVGKRIQIYGTALRWRWLRAGDRVTFSGAIVGGGDDARTLLVQGPRAVLREATADGRPLADGTKLRVYGTLRTFDGPPARLPDGSKTRLYVDVERVELYN